LKGFFGLLSGVMLTFCQFYFLRLLFFASNITFFASRRFLVFFELDFCPVIQSPRFAIDVLIN